MTLRGTANGRLILPTLVESYTGRALGERKRGHSERALKGSVATGRAQRRERSEGLSMAIEEMIGEDKMPKIF